VCYGSCHGGGPETHSAGTLLDLAGVVIPQERAGRFAGVGRREVEALPCVLLLQVAAPPLCCELFVAGSCPIPLLQTTCLLQAAGPPLCKLQMYFILGPNGIQHTAAGCRLASKLLKGPVHGVGLPLPSVLRKEVRSWR
jgi:hypothetical protein